MANDEIRSLYIDQDYNCAESTLRLLNQKYGLGLKEDDFKLVSGFGGGFGCGIACGALCAAVAALGRLAVAERAHATPGFRELCGQYTDAFRKAAGHTDCAEIKKELFREDGTRCLLTVQANLACFESFVAENGLIQN